MRLKSESISFFKEQLRSQRWYMVVMTLVLFAMGPANTLRKLGNDNRNLEVKYFMERYAQMYIRREGMLTSETFMFMLIALLAGILISIITYSYLHYHNQVSFYYSVPMKRTQVFDCKAMASFLSFNIPMVIMMVLTGGVLATQGVLNKYNAFGLVVVIVLNVISFALGYYIAAISMLLTGRILIGVLGTGVLIGYFPAVVSLIVEYFNMFFDTHISRGGIVPNNVWRCVFNVSPIALFSSFEWNSIICYIVTIVSIIILMVLAHYLVKIRPSEAAEKSMAYKVVADVAKVAISIPVGLCLGLFLASTTYQPTAWFYLGTLFGVIVMYMLMQLFYGVELKRIFQQKLQVLAIVGGALVIGSVFFFDLFGYDTYIPNYNNITDINVYFDEIYGGYFPFDEEEVADTICMGKNEELYQFVEEVVASNQECNEQENYKNTTYVYVCYRLNNGKKVTRGYLARVEDIERSAETLWENEAFLDLNYQIRNVDSESIKFVDFSSQVLELENIDFGNDLKENGEFVAALQKDYMELGGLAIMKQNPIAIVGIESSEYGHRYIRADIYPNCTNAIEYLKSKGIDLTSGIKVSDIKELYIAPSQSELNSIYEYGSVATAIENGYEMKVVTNQEEISKMLPKLVDYYLVNIFQESALRDDKCVGIRWKNREEFEMGCYYLLKE